MPRCNARLRKRPGQFCQRWAAKGRARCYFHGGRAKRGVPNPAAGPRLRAVQPLGVAAHQANLARLHQLKRAGLIDKFPWTVKTGPPGQGKNFRPGLTRLQKARIVVRNMKQADTAGALIGFDDDGNTLPAGLAESHGARLERLTGKSLDAFERVLDMDLDPTDDKQYKLVAMQLDAAKSIIKVQAQISEAHFKAQRAGDLWDLLNDIAQVRREPPSE